MSSYRDLTFYHRLHFENAKNIGFDTPGLKIKERIPEKGFVEKLLKYLLFRVNVQRGGSIKRFNWEGETFTVGFAEIRVLGKNKEVYAAPDSVVADVINREYDPPQEFVDAVIEGPDPDSEVYKAFMDRYKPEYCWGASDDYMQKIMPLTAMISSGNLSGLKAIVDTTYLDLVCREGSLLNVAILDRQPQIAEFLISQGINLNKFEGVELLTAVEKGQFSVVKHLVQQDVPIRMDQLRTNPLFLAIGKMQNDIAEWLYVYRKDLVTVYNTEYVQDCNIFQWTKRCRNKEFYKYLLKQYIF